MAPAAADVAVATATPVKTDSKLTRVLLEVAEQLAVAQNNYLHKVFAMLGISSDGRSRSADGLIPLMPPGQPRGGTRGRINH